MTKFYCNKLLLSTLTIQPFLHLSWGQLGVHVILFVQIWTVYHAFYISLCIIYIINYEQIVIVRVSQHALYSMDDKS